ncbi:TPA: arginine--tRNA ligase [Candidatus Saccharibacteria bacterium]|nr:arginine--tRNA ligase [Candidatus Saccharibacteria bacterium]HIO87681.1 arginine--tRNA ligase [Candidatus Saccharibacteria bacterium]
MIRQDLQNILRDALNQLEYTPDEIEVELTDPKFGDASTNVAMRLAGTVDMPPRVVAEQIVDVLNSNKPPYLSAISVAGPGFINFYLTDKSLFDRADVGAVLQDHKPYTGKTFVVEYSDPNPFKALHAGHLYTTLVGNAIGNLYETAGAKVYRVNFGGDVGLHVARAMWGIVHHGSEGSMDEAAGLQYSKQCVDLSEAERAQIVAGHYVAATAAYETNDVAKNQIISFNKRVYKLHEDQDKTSDFAQIYWMWREWSYDYFKTFYEAINVAPFDKYYPESDTTQLGLKTVKEQLKKGVYEDSDGAVVFRGEDYGLHTRVFINSEGLPTYETKDVGLSLHKWQDYKFDTSVIITGNDIVEYMKVVLKSIEQFNPSLSSRTVHLTHGQVKLVGGKKMSSRTGNVLLAHDVLEAATVAAGVNSKNKVAADVKKIAYNAVKYAFLKQAIGGDIAYSPTESLALTGNSSVYLQYTYARALSVLEKVTTVEDTPFDVDLEQAERNLLRVISQYGDTVEDAVNNVAPQVVCQYAFTLCQTFNVFYEKNKVVGSDREALRAEILKKFTQTMDHIFTILGLEKLRKL